MNRILIGFVLFLTINPAHSEGLMGLYERIKVQASEEGSRNSEREARFESSDPSTATRNCEKIFVELVV